MTLDDFNAEGRKPRYEYKLSPVHDRPFLIFKMDQESQSCAVGDYTVLDPEEDIKLSEKKVINLIALLNGRKNLVQLGHETQSRVLYNIVNQGDDEEKSKVIFYHLGKEGVSVENALFTMERDHGA